MSVASPRAVCADVPLFADGLGDRHMAADTSTGEPLQIFSLGPALSAPAVEFAIRERTARFANFRHATFGTVRRVERLPDGRLAVLSDHLEGMRLSDLLAHAHTRGLLLDTGAALCLIGQLLAAVALLHERARDASHGVLAPERLIVTPQARLVVVEHVFGAAVEQLEYGRERLWHELRVAVPASAGLPRLDHRADVNGIGTIALALILGRPLAPSEFPHGVSALLMQLRDRSALTGERPLPNALRNWLARTLQLDVRRAFASAPEALTAFGDVLAADFTCAPAPIALETFLASACGAEPPKPVAGAAVSDPPIQPGMRLVASAGLPRGTSAPEPLLASRFVPTLADLIPVDDLIRPDSPPAASVPATEPSRADATITPALADDGEEGPGDREVAHRGALDAAAGGPDDSVVPAARQPQSPRRWWQRRSAVVASLGVVLALGAGAVLGSWVASGDPESGTLVVQSSPAGVEVFVNGVARGVTPMRLTVPAGSHILELRGRGVPRVIPLQVAAGAQVSQYLEFADAPVTGMLVVHSQPPGARVVVDGMLRGTTPLTIDGLEPGDRQVVLQNETGSSRHVVKVLAGTTASLVAPVVAPASQGPVSGWISVKAPFFLEIYEDGRLIGTTETDRVMLTAGRHVLEFVNQTLGYRERQTVQVPPGRVLPVALQLPTGTLSVNADPWAEVWINGRSMGETPIGNLELTIGAYEIVFRHPQFGERRHAVSVTTAAPVRLSVSMR